MLLEWGIKSYHMHTALVWSTKTTVVLVVFTNTTTKTTVCLEGQAHVVLTCNEKEMSRGVSLELTLIGISPDRSTRLEPCNRY